MNLFKFKKTRKKEQVDSWYVIALKHDNTRHIVSKQTLELVLTLGEGDLFSIIAMGATNNLGWHIGSDNRVYERHVLNEYGKVIISETPRVFSEKNTRIPQFYRGISRTKMMKALNELNSGVSTGKLEREKNIIRWYYKKNLIDSIEEYSGKELINKEKNKNSQMQEKTK